MAEHQRESFRARLIAETKSYLMIFVYLAFFFATFINYRRLVMREYKIGYFEIGFAAIEALVLAKVIIVGRMLGIGERFNDRPLIVPTAYKTFCFSFFVLFFCIFEHVVVGLWHEWNWQKIWNDILGAGKWEILSRVLVLVTALVPLFAAAEIGRVLGQKKLFDLFFRRRKEGAPGGEERMQGGDKKELSAR